jgi:hypothetical protein
MKKNLIVLSSFGLAVATPFIALAQQSTSASCYGPQVSGTVQGVVCKIGEILNTIIPILIVLGVVYFVWGVITYMIGQDEEAKKKGRDKIIYGIIGLVVIVAMWGLVGIITKTFGINNNPVGIQPPCVPGTPGC